MTIRVTAALPLLLAAVGCIEEPRALLVTPSGQSMPKTTLRTSLFGPRVPPHEAVARRVLSVGQKLIDANPQTGVRPLFVTVGLKHPEICHSGGGTRGYQVAVSQGLVEQCKTDNQLAAVLALEIGKIVAERESAAGPSLKNPETTLPPDVPIGTDSGGTYGSADGTRRMELAKLDPKRPKPTRKPAEAPAPETLAKKYLEKAKYDPSALAGVAPMLIRAEGNQELEKLVKPAEILPPVPSRPIESPSAGARQPLEPSSAPGPVPPPSNVPDSRPIARTR